MMKFQSEPGLHDPRFLPLGDVGPCQVRNSERTASIGEHEIEVRMRFPSGSGHPGSDGAGRPLGPNVHWDVQKGCPNNSNEEN